MANWFLAALLCLVISSGCASSINKNTDSDDLLIIREELKKIRLELDEFRAESNKAVHNVEEQNQKLTVKWLASAVSEIKTELGEVQTTLNSTIILQNHEEVDTELRLLKSDVQNLNKELEEAKKKNVKYEVQLLEIREELAFLKDNTRSSSVSFGKMKNQLRAIQLELNHRNKENQTDLALVPSTRHQRLLKKHILDLERTSKMLHKENQNLKHRLLKAEDEIQFLKRSSEIELNSINSFQAAPLPFADIQKQIGNNTESIANITKQLSNFDKLHLSMLELLENVEAIENKVDKTFPLLEKEISKLEIQNAESAAALGSVKEGQKNLRNSVKAIGVSVSYMQDKTDADHVHLKDMDNKLKSLLSSMTMQTSKLHDHILKVESKSVDLNASKSAIQLSEELKTFEDSYKSIVNKLPRDCGEVDGPPGVYLLSPGDQEPIVAKCEDGWTTIQKRFDGSVDFNRNWSDYSKGFGSALGEHWIGNSNLHLLTKDNCTEMKINMKDIYGKFWEVKYSDFRVASEKNGFKLIIDGYSGNASNALDYQNKMEFSTSDNDRDISNAHCAKNYEGGWWFSHCQHANLNGRYNLGLTWFDISRNEWIAVATSEMKVRRKSAC